MSSNHSMTLADALPKMTGADAYMYHWLSAGNALLILGARDVSRFWRYVDKTDTCWNWTGSTFASGAGAFGVAGKVVLARRLSYALHIGDSLDGMSVIQTCGNVQCVRPEHLEAVTVKQSNETRSGWNREGLPRGVIRDGDGFRVQVGHNGAMTHYGPFPTVDAADEFVKALRAELHTHSHIRRVR